MIFIIFRDFSGFFWIFFYDFIFSSKHEINKKMGAGPAWMRRGTQGHVAVPRGPAQCLRGAYYIVFIFIVNIKRFSAFPIWEGSYP